jgi:hypothetical protein
MEAAEIASINHPDPPILGDFKSWGTPPDPRQKASCTSFSTVSYENITGVITKSTHF